MVNVATTLAYLTSSSWSAGTLAETAFWIDEVWQATTMDEVDPLGGVIGDETHFATAFRALCETDSLAGMEGTKDDCTDFVSVLDWDWMVPGVTKLERP